MEGVLLAVVGEGDGDAVWIAAAAAAAGGGLFLFMFLVRHVCCWLIGMHVETRRSGGYLVY